MPRQRISRKSEGSWGWAISGKAKSARRVRIFTRMAAKFIRGRALPASSLSRDAGIVATNFVLYSIGMSLGGLMETAKVFWSGRSQAVRLPKNFRVEGREVRIRRQGPAIVLEPVP